MYIYPQHRHETGTGCACDRWTFRSSARREAQRTTSENSDLHQRSSGIKYQNLQRRGKEMAASGGGGSRRISAASARAHTRKHRQGSSLGFFSSSALLKTLLLVSSIGIAVWIYQACLPPPPKICGSPDGPPVTASRIKLKDGRYLAYKEHGIPKEKAKYNIIFMHGFGSDRHDVLPLSTELTVELGIYLVSFDRPGYGESDPDPRRSEKSIALDVQELANRLDLGATFYVIGFSMGGEAVWSCLKYIPHRLAGATLIAPVVNYWWPALPANLSKQAYSQQLVQDQWALRVAHYLPWLTYWWNTQKWFPASSVVSHHPDVFSPADKELFPKFTKRQEYQAQSSQQGEYESIYRDMMVFFGSWEFSPTDISNPFPNGEGSVHLWQGDDDRLVPVLLQRHIVDTLPWIHYHELSGLGHVFLLADGMADAIVRAQLVGK